MHHFIGLYKCIHNPYKKCFSDLDMDLHIGYLIRRWQRAVEQS